MTTARIMLLLDLAALALVWPIVLAAGLATPAAVAGVQFALLLLIYPSSHLVLLFALGFYRRDALIDTRKSLSRIPLVTALSAVGGTVLAWLLSWPLAKALGPLPGLAQPLVMAFGCFLVCGVAARLCFRALRQRGVIRRRLLVVGAGRRAWDLAWMLRNEGRNLKYDVLFAHEPGLGEVDPRLAEGAHGAIVSATEPCLLHTADAFGPDQIVVAPDEQRGMDLRGLLACKTAGYPVQQYLSFVEAETRRIDLKRMQLGWLLYSEGFSVGVIDRFLKRALDVGVSAVLLLPGAPLMLLAMAAIKLDDGGPVFYHQTRITRGGQPFAITKLRTMRVDAEAAGAVWAAQNDSRITRIGNLLRRSRLDELPQLFNVLRGDMSLVGPRPERPDFVTMLTEQIPLYAERHLVKAGLTGWAQINYPYGASVNDARSKLSYDLYYAKNFSVLFDVMIILQTLRVLFWPGASVR